MIACDRAPIRKAVKTPEGFLLVEADTVKPGVYPYLWPDGTTRRVLKPEAEILHPESLASMGRKPVTLDHPPELVTADNVQTYGVGDVDGEIEAMGGFVRVKVAVRNAAAVQAIENGDATEVSWGFEHDLDETPGVWEGIPYDAAQRGIRYNHLAIVKRGRVGGARLLMDSAELIAANETGGSMKINVKGTEYDCSPDLAAAIEAEREERTTKAEADEATHAAQLKKAKADEERLAGELDACKATIKDLEEKIKKKDEEKPKEKEGDAMPPDVFKSRLRLILAATQMGVDKADELAEADLRSAIVTKAGLAVDGKSAEYIAAACDVLVIQRKAADKVEADLLKRIAGLSEDGKQTDTKDAVEEARKAYAARQTGRKS